MNIIITAGGTRERIDSVRAITNEATGRLGSMIAEEFSQRLTDKKYQIYYICGMNAATPKVKEENLSIIRIEGTSQLLGEMEELLTKQKINAVIHSMAVSDYRVSSITTLELAAQSLYQKLTAGPNNVTYEELQLAMLQAVKEQTLMEHKISSNLENPLLLLEKTPKIIGIIKKISPETKLVGFKLLSDVSKEELFETAFGLLQRNQCDYVLANDNAEISEDRHVGYLFDKAGDYQTFTGKAEIAKGIVDCILKS
jgi:phosphopantothenate---cysteine ligase (CTP)